MELSANAGQVKSAVDKAVNEFAVRGFRSLGVARAEGDGQWQFLGVLPLFDPPREDAKSTIATAAQMGVKIKMVTGDQLAIAQETAKKLGMGANILDASGLGDVKREETSAVAESIENADGFAQVFPEHKFHIVDVLQKRGHIVGMTGDGVNDAPALKKADCGVAVSGATDAARAAAAIVLLSAGLSVIIDAIKESRKIFQRMNSYAMYRIAETLRVLLFMTLAILIFNFYPLTAIMIVMLALLNDGAILSIAYDNVHYKDEPEAWNMRVVLGIATVLGVIGPVAAFGLFYLGDQRFSPQPSTSPDHDVSYAVCGRSSHDFPDAHARPVLVHSPRQGPIGGSARHANAGDSDCGLWTVYDTSRLGLCAVRLGVCAGVGPGERPRETAGISGFRSCQSLDTARFDIRCRRRSRAPDVVHDCRFDDDRGGDHVFDDLDDPDAGIEPYTSHILRNFMRATVTQVVLGMFAGIFTYCLIVLRTILSGDEGDFVPNLAVFVGILPAIRGIVALILFIHHIASLIQASSIISSVAEETLVTNENALQGTPLTAMRPLSRVADNASLVVTTQRKPLAQRIIPELENKAHSLFGHYSSRNSLIRPYRKLREVLQSGIESENRTAGRDD